MMRLEDEEGVAQPLRAEHRSEVRRPVVGADAIGHLGDPGERDGPRRL